MSVSSIVSSQCKDMFDVVQSPHDKLRRKYRWAYPSEHAQRVRWLAGKLLAIIFATYLALAILVGLLKVFGNDDGKVSVEDIMRIVLAIKLPLLALPLYIAWATTEVRARIEDRL